MYKITVFTSIGRFTTEVKDGKYVQDVITSLIDRVNTFSIFTKKTCLIITGDPEIIIPAKHIIAFTVEECNDVR